MKTGYSIDMDGVIYREDQLIPGAIEFVEALIGIGAPFAFLTNNSSPTKPNGYMFHRACRKLADMAGGASPESIVVIGDTMETDIRGAVEASLQAYLVLSGATNLDNVAEYVYQPTRVLHSVADLIEELKSGKPSSRLDSPVFKQELLGCRRFGNRHQTDAEHPAKSRPRAPMTR
jgi:NagD protein